MSYSLFPYTAVHEKLFFVAVDRGNYLHYPDFLHDNSGRETDFINHASSGNECQQGGWEGLLVFWENTLQRENSAWILSIIVSLFDSSMVYNRPPLAYREGKSLSLLLHLTKELRNPPRSIMNDYLFVLVYKFTHRSWVRVRVDRWLGRTLNYNFETHKITYVWPVDGTHTSYNKRDIRKIFLHQCHVVIATNRIWRGKSPFTRHTQIIHSSLIKHEQQCSHWWG